MAKRVCYSTSTDISSNLACLHEDLLDSILDKLVSLSDFIRFGAVCKSWNSITLIHKEKRMRLSIHQLPWLLVSNFKDGIEKLSLYNFTTADICSFQLRLPFNYTSNSYIGSSHGWLFSMEKSVLLVSNPLSGTNFRLPPFDSKRFGRASNATLSRDPCLGPFKVIATSYKINVVAYVEYGDEFWTYSESENYYLTLFKFAFYKDRILGVFHSGQMVSLEVVYNGGGDDTNSSSKLSCRRIKVKKIPHELMGICSSDWFLVEETTNGDLLMVLRLEHKISKRYVIFKVIDLIDLKGEIKCIPVVDLGGHSLFLGSHNCNPVLVSAIDYPRYCRPNSIYYSYENSAERRSMLRTKGLGNYKYGIEEYNLDDQNILEDRSVETSFQAPWIVPTMFNQQVAERVV